MNLDGLKLATEKRLARIEEHLAFCALSDDTVGLDRRRYRVLSKMDIAAYLQPGETIEVHRSFMPPDERGGWDDNPRVFNWGEWTPLRVENIGDCVRLLVPKYGSMPVPRGDFVRAVLVGNVRAPASDRP